MNVNLCTWEYALVCLRMASAQYPWRQITNVYECSFPILVGACAHYPMRSTCPCYSTTCPLFCKLSFNLFTANPFALCLINRLSTEKESLYFSYPIDNKKSKILLFRLHAILLVKLCVIKDCDKTHFPYV
jgi:hypothetical protein